MPITATIQEDAPLMPVGFEPRTRRNFGKIMTPAEPPRVRLLPDGAVAVELGGRHGQRKEVILDVEHWDKARRISEWWTVSTNGKWAKTVCSGKTSLRDIARQAETTHPRTALARVVTNAGPGMTVVFRDHDFLNCRKANLEVITKREAWLRYQDLAWLLRGEDVEAIGEAAMRGLWDGEE